ncbi:MAG TPA: DUF4440 domain-containing protein [Ilumatobacteraceae bacterium]|nr:DUF4440 domain-containing protein [Ilumatobacteraceae bacterium]
MDVGELIRPDTEIWQALVDGDAEADARLLADDFVGVYPTGLPSRSPPHGCHAQVVR